MGSGSRKSVLDKDGDGDDKIKAILQILLVCTFGIHQNIVSRGEFAAIWRKADDIENLDTNLIDWEVRSNMQLV